MTKLLLPALAALLALPACGALDFRQPVKVSHPVRFTPGGVRYQTVYPGTGEPVAPGSWVRVHYSVDVQGGRPVDSTFTRGIPEEFRMGEAPLEGWNEGLIGMRPGGRRELVIPADLAYGQGGVDGLVPPGAVLECLVEMVDVSATPWP